ncbi:hypothetical protein HZH68_015895 [Vespula germanica]|uniref:Uncharacterized protein n=1 Tax=Vespula germanica TaxID=30212 RepID=A0A834MQI9_VESGE|nr:hypothetical protein HZH68_015895 [Vespula germanica]
MSRAKGTAYRASLTPWNPVRLLSRVPTAGWPPLQRRIQIVVVIVVVVVVVVVVVEGPMRLKFYRRVSHVSNVGKYMALLRAKTSILYAFGRAPKSDTLMVNPRPFSRPIVVGRLFRDTLGCGLTRCHRQQSTMTTMTTTTTTTTTTTMTMTMTTTTTTMLLSSSKGTNANNTNVKDLTIVLSLL